MRMPSLFISHGSPEFALAPGVLGAELAGLAANLPRPRAVLVMSPHWMTRGVEVQSTPMPATVHDFGGFSPTLYELDYQAPGAPGIAAEVLRRLSQAGFRAGDNDRVGRDHGTWVPLMHLYPAADVPVLQLSQPFGAVPRDFLALGQALAPLAEEDVLIVGSGGVTHNLYDFRSAAAGAYVRPFAHWLAARIAAGDLDALLDYRQQAPGAARAHPTDEHLLPLYFAIGAAGDNRFHSRRIDGGIVDSVLAMDTYVFSASIGETP